MGTHAKRSDTIFNFLFILVTANEKNSMLRAIAIKKIKHNHNHNHMLWQGQLLCKTSTSFNFKIQLELNVIRYQLATIIHRIYVLLNFLGFANLYKTINILTDYYFLEILVHL